VTTARDNILAAIRVALADRPSTTPVTRNYQRSTPPGAEVVAQFAERAADYRATVTHAGPARLPATIAAALRERGIRRLAVPAGLPAQWLADSHVEHVADTPPLTTMELDSLDGVITTAAGAISLTGTIILDGGEGQGRRALSLLPDFHLCVVRASQIAGTVPEALARLDPRRPQTWISGPSATSDIELDRVEGVHGPRVLHIVIALGE
jgi:L-lactate dehydrogenase complex protein LldG